MEFQPVAVSATADAGNTGIVDPDLVPPVGLGPQDVADDGADHPRVSNHQDTLSRGGSGQPLIGPPDSGEKALQGFGARRAIGDRVSEAWEPYGQLVSNLPPELRDRHSRLYMAAVQKAQESGWNPSVDDEDE